MGDKVKEKVLKQIAILVIGAFMGLSKCQIPKTGKFCVVSFGGSEEIKDNPWLHDPKIMARFVPLGENRSYLRKGLPTSMETDKTTGEEFRPSSRRDANSLALAMLTQELIGRYEIGEVINGIDAAIELPAKGNFPAVNAASRFTAPVNHMRAILAGEPS